MRNTSDLRRSGAPSPFRHTPALRRTARFEGVLMNGLKHPATIIAVSALLAALGGGGGAYAVAATAFVGNQGSITACIEPRNGELHVLPMRAKCPPPESAVALNQRGQRGLRGPRGASGTRGAKGNTGATGATAATGPQGPKGDPGATGATGPQGPKGDPGATGATGAIGADGRARAAGAEGRPR